GLSQPLATGGLSGSVMDDKGKSVPNAAISISLLPSGQLAPAFFTNTRTGEDGRFQVSGIPPGAYQICAQTSTVGIIDSCQWGTPAATATVQAGTTAAAPPIALTKGHLVHVRVNDPLGLLQASEAVVQGAHLLIGVWTSKGLFVPTAVGSKDA